MEPFRPDFKGLCARGRVGKIRRGVMIPGKSGAPGLQFGPADGVLWSLVFLYPVLTVEG